MNSSYPIFLPLPSAAQETSVMWREHCWGGEYHRKAVRLGRKGNMVTAGARLVFSLNILDTELLYPVFQTIRIDKKTLMAIDRNLRLN